MIFLMLSSIGYSQVWNNKNIDSNLLTITLDGSRLIEDKSNTDSGLDVALTFVMLRQFKIRPLIKFEAFPNLEYYKTSLGVEYVIPIKDIFELSAGVEVGMISRSTSEYEAYFGYTTYGFNGDIRLFEPLKNFPIVISYNIQKRNDLDIWGADPKFIGSLFVGVGWSF